MTGNLEAAVAFAGAYTLRFRQSSLSTLKEHASHLINEGNARGNMRSQGNQAPSSEPGYIRIVMGLHFKIALSRMKLDV